MAYLIETGWLRDWVVGKADVAREAVVEEGRSNQAGEWIMALEQHDAVTALFDLTVA